MHVVEEEVVVIIMIMVMVMIIMVITINNYDKIYIQHMELWALVNVGSGNALLSGGTKPIPEANIDLSWVAIGFFGSSDDNAPRWMPWDITDDSQHWFS